MTYNRRSIRKFKGQRVRINYIVKGHNHDIVGEITAQTNDSALFLVNKEDPEIRLSYNQINKITKLANDKPGKKIKGKAD